MPVVEQAVGAKPRPAWSSKRSQPISAIVLHDTASRTAGSAIDWFHHPDSQVSAHVVIDRDGKIYRIVPDNRTAWHAGRSLLHGVANVNSFSLGVELVDVDTPGDDNLAYTDAQLQAAADWCAQAAAAYTIPLNRIVGHDQVCVPYGRKRDPGWDFPWSLFLLEVARQILLLEVARQIRAGSPG